MFKAKTTLITGGSSGLGLALAKSLAKRQADLILVARDKTKLEAAKAEILTETPNAQVAIYSLDVTKADQIEAQLADILSSHQSQLDILINCAGILREGYFETLASKDFEDVMQVNYFGLLNITRAALPYLKQSKGRLVNIGSIAGLTGVFGYTPYCSAKHALIGLTDSLRYELKPQGIKVHMVCPGEFDSPMVDAFDASRTPENRAHTLSIPKSSVEFIVSETIKGLEKDKYQIIPGKTARFFARLMRWFPSLSRSITDKTIAKVYVGPK
ncbi:MAG: SDR family NAD(P)-dependent oxidoreductase [Vibrio sp.]